MSRAGVHTGTLTDVCDRPSRRVRLILAALACFLTLGMSGAPAAATADVVSLPDAGCAVAQCQLEHRTAPATCTGCGNDHRPLATTVGAALVGAATLLLAGPRLRERWMRRAATTHRLLRPPQFDAA